MVEAGIKGLQEGLNKSSLISVILLLLAFSFMISPVQSQDIVGSKQMNLAEQSEVIADGDLTIFLEHDSESDQLNANAELINMDDPGNTISRVDIETVLSDGEGNELVRREENIGDSEFGSDHTFTYSHDLEEDKESVYLNVIFTAVRPSQSHDNVVKTLTVNTDSIEVNQIEELNIASPDSLLSTSSSAIVVEDGNGNDITSKVAGSGILRVVNNDNAHVESELVGEERIYFLNTEDASGSLELEAEYDGLDQTAILNIEDNPELGSVKFLQDSVSPDGIANLQVKSNNGKDITDKIHASNVDILTHGIDEDVVKRKYRNLLINLSEANEIENYDDITIEVTYNGEAEETSIEIEEDQESGEKFAGGSGTESDPYIINTCDQLQEIDPEVGELNNEDQLSAHYKLESDIDCSNKDDFEPIGGTFKGIFDGNGYIINDLKIQKGDLDLVGLFKKVKENGEIRNLGLENIEVNSGDGGGASGTIVGNLKNGEVESSYSEGSIDSGNTFVGGMIGVLMEDATLKDSYSRVNVKDHTDGAVFSGLVGETSGDIEGSYSVGTVESEFEDGSIGGRGLTNGYTNSHVTNSYWDIEASGIEESEGGTGLTTSEMQGESAKENMEGFDFEDTWATQEGGYPVLRWQLDNLVEEDTSDSEDDGVTESQTDTGSEPEKRDLWHSRNIFFSEETEVTEGGEDNRVVDEDLINQDSHMVYRDNPEPFYVHIGNSSTTATVNGENIFEENLGIYELGFNNMDNNDEVHEINARVEEWSNEEEPEKLVLKINSSDIESFPNGGYQLTSIRSTEDNVDREVSRSIAPEDIVRLKVIEEPMLPNDQLDVEHKIFWQTMAVLENPVFKWEAATLAGVPRGNDTFVCEGGASCSVGGSRVASDQNYIPEEDYKVEFGNSDWETKPAFGGPVRIIEVVKETREKAYNGLWNQGRKSVTGDIFNNPEESYTKWQNDVGQQIGYCKDGEADDPEDCSWLAVSSPSNYAGGSIWGDHFMTPKGELLEVDTPYIRPIPDEALNHQSEYLDQNKNSPDDFCYGDNSYSSADYAPPEYNKFTSGEPVKVLESRTKEGVNLSTHYSAMDDYSCPGWVESGLSDLDIPSGPDMYKNKTYCPSYLNEGECGSYVQNSICDPLDTGKGPCEKEELQTRDGETVEGADQVGGGEEIVTENIDITLNSSGKLQSSSFVDVSCDDGCSEEQYCEVAGSEDQDNENCEPIKVIEVEQNKDVKITFNNENSTLNRFSVKDQYVNTRGTGSVEYELSQHSPGDQVQIEVDKVDGDQYFGTNASAKIVVKESSSSVDDDETVGGGGSLSDALAGFANDAYDFLINLASGSGSDEEDGEKTIDIRIENSGEDKNGDGIREAEFNSNGFIDNNKCDVDSQGCADDPYCALNNGDSPNMCSPAEKVIEVETGSNMTFNIQNEFSLPRNISFVGEEFKLDPDQSRTFEENFSSEDYGAGDNEGLLLESVGDEERTEDKARIIVVEPEEEEEEEAKEDISGWEQYCRNNLDVGEDEELTSQNMTDCISPCYKGDGFEDGEATQPEGEVDMTCPDLVENFCTDGRHSSYIEPKVGDECLKIDRARNCDPTMGPVTNTGCVWAGEKCINKESNTDQDYLSGNKCGSEVDLNG